MNTHDLASHTVREMGVGYRHRVYCTCGYTMSNRSMNPHSIPSQLTSRLTQHIAEQR